MTTPIDSGVETSGAVRSRRVSSRDAALRAGDRFAIGELNACFAEALDQARFADLHDLFTETAVYRSGSTVLEGRDAIVRSFMKRGALGPRTTRHFCSGLRLVFDDSDPNRMTARGVSVWLSFAANAEPPVDTAVPFMVADFDDRYELGGDGHWRLAMRTITPVFRNAATAPLGAAT